MILWMVGLLAMLWAVAVGAATSVWDPLTGLEPGELRLTGAVLCLLGAGSILGSRLQAGFLHLARGAFGQLALLGAMGCFALVSSNVGFEGGSVVEFDLASMKLAPATVGIFLLTLLGALFVVWPPASEATPRRVEPDAAAARISSPNLS